MLEIHNENFKSFNLESPKLKQSSKAMEKLRKTYNTGFKVFKELNKGPIYSFGNKSHTLKWLRKQGKSNIGRNWEETATKRVSLHF